MRVSLGGSTNSRVLLMVRSIVLLGILVTGVTRGADAQRLSDPFPVALAHSDSFSLVNGGILGPGDRDHRYTGFHVGLGAGAGLGIYAIAECSGRNDCAVRPVPFALLSLVVFSITGALIGALIPK